MKPKRIIKIGAKQRQHTRIRFWERFGIGMNQAALRQLEGRIRAKDGVLLAKSGTRRTWLMEVEDGLCIVVYDKLTKHLVTVLPDEAMFKYIIPYRWKHLRQYQDRIVNEIRHNRFTPLKKKDNYTTYLQVVVDGLTFFVGFNKRIKELVDYDLTPPSNHLVQTTPDSDLPSLPLEDQIPSQTDSLCDQGDQGMPEQQATSAMTDLM